MAVLQYKDPKTSKLVDLNIPAGIEDVKEAGQYAREKGKWSKIKNFKSTMVDSLPEVGDTDTIYMVHNNKLLMPPIGASILSTDNKYYKADEWNQPNENAIGVVVNGELHYDNERIVFMISKDEADKAWSTERKLIDGITTSSADSGNGVNFDYNGPSSTYAITYQDYKAEAARYCDSYKFANNAKGYLAGMGEWRIALSSKSEIDACMTKIGGTPLKVAYNDYYWSCSQYNPAIAWVFAWSSFHQNSAAKSALMHTRVFARLPISNSVYDEYLYINGKWELLGDEFSEADDYVTKSELEWRLLTKATENGLNEALRNVVTTDDYRLTNARPASDVEDWAKAYTKPTYTASEVGLGNVNNTSDANKPISTATQTALDKKIEDAASDGSLYGRKNKAWSKIVIPTVDVNKQYVDTELAKKANKTDLDFWKGANTVSTLVNLPVTKRSIVATVTAATNLSLATDMKVGKELYIRVFNNSAGEITQAIPNAGKYVSMSGASVKIPSKSFIEISIWCYDTNKYSIRVGEVSK